MSVLVAAALDLALGEPPARAHPVVWAGRYLDGAARIAPAAPRARAVAAGGAVWLLGAGVAAAAGWSVERYAARGPWRHAIRGLALWPLLSGRLLFAEVAAVDRALADDLRSGRRRLARIVSRDVTELSAGEVRAAALESLAENLSDSVVAPLAWYVVAGLPGAAVYRFANTADACWGYRSPRWRWTGRAAARADDLMNLLPARLTAALLLPRCSSHTRRALRVEAGRTESPNAGWPMAALALRLDVRLTKPGAYALNPHAADPGPAHTAAALRAARRAALVAIAAAATAEHLQHLDRPRPRRPRGASR